MIHMFDRVSISSLSSIKAESEWMVVILARIRTHIYPRNSGSICRIDSDINLSKFAEKKPIVTR